MDHNYSSETINMFHALLRSALSTGEYVSLHNSDVLIEDVISLAKKQDVLSLICHGINKNNGHLPSQAKRDLIKEIYNYSQNEYLLKKAKDILNKAKIPYMPLKGVIIKDLYPDPWMRNSCDVDILIHERDIEKAVQSLVESGFTTDNKKEYHDISLYFGSAHLELHFNICENIPRIDNVLEQVWENAILKTDYEYMESDDFFAFHIVAHMLYHFLRGGCTIKQFVDLWLLRSNHVYEEEKIQSLLSLCKLEQFYHVMCRFTNDLFMGRKQTELSHKIETVVLLGGMRQYDKQPDNIDITINGGIGRYIFHYIFLSKREMVWIYPILRKHPILLPFYYVKRMLSKTIGKDRGRAKEVIKANKVLSDKTDKFLKEIGLS